MIGAWGPWDTLLGAIEERDRLAAFGAPLALDEHLERDGIELARTFESANGKVCWRIMPPEKE